MDMREKIVFFINGLNESRLFMSQKCVYNSFSKDDGDDETTTDDLYEW